MAQTQMAPQFIPQQGYSSVQMAGPSTGPVTQATTKPVAKNSMRICGIIQICCAVLLFAMQIGLIAEKSPIHFVGVGIWTSIFFALAGGFGVQASKTGNKCPTVACLVLSIFATISALTGIGLDATDLGITVQYDYNWYERKYYYRGLQHPKAIKGLLSVAILAFVVEFIVSIVQASFSCAGLCCKKSPPQVQVVYQYVTVPVSGMPNTNIGAVSGPSAPAPGAMAGAVPFPVDHSKATEAALQNQFALPPQAATYPQAQGGPVYLQGQAPGQEVMMQAPGAQPLMQAPGAQPMYIAGGHHQFVQQGQAPPNYPVTNAAGNPTVFQGVGQTNGENPPPYEG